jgi:CDP-glycerol glycerophosphotransferase (TagB/SpsB family)
MMSGTFNFREENIDITGLPRTDSFFTDNKDIYIDSHPHIKSIMDNKDDWEKIILYAPTFRRDKENIDYINYQELNKILVEQNTLFVVSLHPKLYKVNNDDEFSNIEFIEAGWDVYPFLKDFDMLITDYGSIFTDYLILNKPILFYTPDIDEYEKVTGLYNGYKDLSPGPIIKEQSELFNFIEKINTEDEWKEKRNNLIEKFHTYVDGNSSERVSDLIDTI